MGNGYEIWQVEVIKRAWVWAMDKNKVDIQEVGKEA
jgi:hypothetical protein